MLYRRNRYFNPNGGQFTQADPLGIAGGMNAFGFAEGDPVNFGDPFGLYIQPISDPALRRIIGVLLQGSPTFKKIWYALAIAAKDKVNLSVREAVGKNELGRVRKAGMGGGLTEGEGSPDVTVLLELIQGMQPGSAEGIVAHEFAHAAGKYTKKGAANTGVPAVCGNGDADPFAPSLACAEGVRSRVNDELSASQAKKEKKP